MTPRTRSIAVLSAAALAGSTALAALLLPRPWKGSSGRKDQGSPIALAVGEVPPEASVWIDVHAPDRVWKWARSNAWLDRAATGQEDLIIAFTELFSAPTSRHVLAFTLAAFIDLIVFLLAYASGPFFFGAPEELWLKAGATLDSADEQLFARDLLRKVGPSASGLVRLEAAALTPGEQQFVLLLASRGLAAAVQEEGGRFYLLDASVHRTLAESLAHRGLTLRASAAQPAGG